MLMTIRFRLLIVILCTVLIVWKIFQYYGLDSGTSSEQFKAFLLSTQSDKLVQETVRVTIYYEALCSDSRNFIIKHLLPTYSLLSTHIILDLVPYGKAKTIKIDDGSIQFQCQHTATECVGNKLHACAINQITNQMLQLKFVACMIDDGLIPYEMAEKCANENNVDYKKLISCANDIEGSLLLEKHGLRTNEVRPSITFIPTVELNGKQNVPLPKILKNFKQHICLMYKQTPLKCLSS